MPNRAWSVRRVHSSYDFTTRHIQESSLDGTRPMTAHGMPAQNAGRQSKLRQVEPFAMSHIAAKSVRSQRNNLIAAIATIAVCDIAFGLTFPLMYMHPSSCCCSLGEGW